MENAQVHRQNAAPGHGSVGLATSGEWGCFHPILFAAQALYWVSVSRHDKPAVLW